MLRCVQDTPKLTVNIIENFFTKHLENRAAATTSGASTLWDYAGASQALALIIQTSAALNPGSQLHRSNSGGNNFHNNNRGNFQGGRGGSRGRGASQGYQGYQSFRGRGGRGGGSQNHNIYHNRQVGNQIPDNAHRVTLHFSRASSRCSESGPSASGSTRENPAPTGKVEQGHGAPSPTTQRRCGTSVPSPCQMGKPVGEPTPPWSTSKPRTLLSETRNFTAPSNAWDPTRKPHGEI